MLVGLSIDGPRALHDAYRVDKGGKPTFDKVMAAARLLQRSGVDFNVLCSVHAANAGRPLEVYRFFRDELGGALLAVHPDRRARDAAALADRQPRLGQRGARAGRSTCSRAARDQRAIGHARGVGRAS